MDNARLLREYLVSPPENNFRTMADYLVTHRIKYGRARYWDAYVVTFMARERDVNDAVYEVVLRLHGSVSAEHGIGQLKAELLQRVKRALLAEHGDADAEYRVGDVVRFPTPDGQASFAGVVREVEGEGLLFDFNHPLAGRPVIFEVELIGIL